MPSYVIRPGADSGVQQWEADPGDQTQAAVLSDTDDLTFINSLVNADKSLMAVAQLPLDVWKITSIGIVARFSGSGTTPTARVFWKLGGVTVNGTTRSLAGTPTNFTDAAIARPGGGSWTPADLATLEVGVESIAVGGGQNNCYDLKLDVVATVYDVEPASDRTVVSTATLPDEPIRFSVTVQLDDDDIALIDGDVTRLCTVGSFILPSTSTLVYLTLSRASVQNPRT